MHTILSAGLSYLQIPRSDSTDPSSITMSKQLGHMGKVYALHSYEYSVLSLFLIGIHIDHIYVEDHSNEFYDDFPYQILAQKFSCIDYMNM